MTIIKMSAKYGGVGKFSIGDERSSRVLTTLYNQNSTLFEMNVDHAIENHEYARQVVSGTMYHFKIPFKNNIHYIKVWHKLDNTYEIIGRSIE